MFPLHTVKRLKIDVPVFVYFTAWYMCTPSMGIGGVVACSLSLSQGQEGCGRRSATSVCLELFTMCGSVSTILLTCSVQTISVDVRYQVWPGFKLIYQVQPLAAGVAVVSPLKIQVVYNNEMRWNTY